MENIDKELTVLPNCVVRPKITQMPQKIAAQNICPSPKVRDFRKKNYLWVSAFRDYDHNIKVDDYFFAGSYSSLRRS